MSVQYLATGKWARVTHGQVQAELVVISGGPAVLEAAGAGGSAAVTSHRVSSLKIVMPPIGSQTNLLARPETGSTFPEGAAVQLTLSIGQPGNLVQLVGPRIDVGALHEAELAHLKDDEGLLGVMAVKVDDVGLPDEQLTALSRASQYASRRLLRQRAVSSAENGLALLVDRSASMRPHLRSGAVQAVLEAVLGVDRGLGDGGEVPVLTLGRSVEPLVPLGPDNASDYVDRQLLPLGAATGTRLAASIGTRGLDDGPRTILVLTDQIPGDVAEFQAALERSSQGVRWRLVVLGEPEEISPVRAYREVDASAIGTELSPESLTTGPGHDSRLDDLVVGLVGLSASGERTSS